MLITKFQNDFLNTQLNILSISERRVRSSYKATRRRLSAFNILENTNVRNQTSYRNLKPKNMTINGTALLSTTINGNAISQAYKRSTLMAHFS